MMMILFLQFLLTKDKTKDKTRIKLNDFNRAEFMLWDEHALEYCQYNPGGARGNVSSLSFHSPKKDLSTKNNPNFNKAMLLTKKCLFPIVFVSGDRQKNI
jgi:hypothetical protein